MAGGVADRRDEIVRVARSWVGTPYRHQAGAKGVGTDCLGLVRGVWREIVGPEPIPLPPYSRHWGECGEDEALWRALGTFLLRAEPAVSGDVVLLRMIEAGPAKHVGILSRRGDGVETIIHAHSGRSVVEAALSEPWRRRVVAAFRFPERN